VTPPSKKKPTRTRAKASAAEDERVDYRVRSEPDSQAQAKEREDQLPDRVLEALEWLAESARRSRAIVADAVRTMDDATARAANGGQV